MTESLSGWVGRTGDMESLLILPEALDQAAVFKGLETQSLTGSFAQM